MKAPVKGAGGPAIAAEESELVAAVLAKDRKASAELIACHADAIYSYVLHRLRPRIELVDDLVQEIFLAAWTHLADFRGTSPLRNWLMGIARHKVEDHYRARFRELTVFADSEEDAPPVPASDPRVDELLDRREVREKTQRVLQALPETYSVVLLWRYWEKRSVREIAEQTGKTEKAVERLVWRAREQFKRRWRDAEAAGR